ncbi:MAG: CRTAC1 family protein [Planctomycetota bacterium]
MARRLFVDLGTAAQEWALGLALAALGCGGGDPRPTAVAGGAPAPEGRAPAPAAALPWLVDVRAASGVDFVHQSGGRGDWVLTEIMGGGAALFDADGDGHLDLLLLQGGADPGAEATLAAGTGHRLYLGDGALGFRDVTPGSGLEGMRGYAMCPAIGDVDGDGRVDIYLAQRGQDVLLLNRGGGRFEDVSSAWGLRVGGWSSAAAFADLDRDGDLDVFVVRYMDLNPGLECRDGAGRRTYCPPKSGDPVHDVLLMNEGGRFVERSQECGISTRAGAGLGVVVQDLTSDGVADIYVTNDGYENHLWVRRADGTWRDEGLARGAALNQAGLAEASMGIIAEDLDGDLALDLFMTHLKDETHTLYRGRSGNYMDETGRRGLAMATKPGTGFGIAAIDLELDGDLDLLVAQGRVSVGAVAAGCALPEPWDSLAEPNLLLLNDGQGVFAARAELAPDLTSPVTIDRAIASGDLDEDGDVDLVVTRIEGPPLVLRNDAPRAGTWVRVDPREARGAATALGALVYVTPTAEAAGGARVGVTHVRPVRASDGYLTSRDPRPTFGLARGVARDVSHVDVEVLWPDGTRETFPGLATGATHVVVRGEGGR